jgi:predicted MarR family transcription regulator
VPAVLEAGLIKHHPDQNERDAIVQEIAGTLNPETLDEVLYALCKLAFPRLLARIEEAKAKDKGDGSPNVQSGAAL